jgi:hypothetical protein
MLAVERSIRLGRGKETKMQQSTEVREAMLRFYDRLSASDVGSFDELVSQEPATLIIGSAPESGLPSERG